ncbi:MAG: TIGR02588 family protein [Actinomycetota bacterium]|nr:TIGR02588 family protein [Actinomycetota bacterium]
MSGDETRQARSAAEWVTFAVASAILAVIIGLVVREIPNSKRPPLPVAVVGRSEPRGDRFVVAVAVENRGERAAQEVQVSATLTVDGEEQTADQVVDFLSGGERVDLELLFDDDPSDGELEVEVTGYRLP